MKKLIIPLTLTILLFASCSRDARREADLRGIDFEVNIERFDSAYWTIDTTNIAAGMQSLAQKYPDITPIYLERVVGFGPVDAEITHYTYNLFRRDTAVYRLYTDCLTSYSNMSDLNRSLTDAFRRGRYFFPRLTTPRIYCHVSGFNQSVIVGDGFMSLSLDNYLGTDYPIYTLIDIYEYQRANMTRAKVVPDYISAWLTSEYYQRPNSTLLDDIIYHGKILYATSCLLPETPDNIIMGYTPGQMKWIQTNEAELWHIMMGNRVLYETSAMIKGQYLNDGPFTLPFSQESPARGGAYIGWQIVNHFMTSNQSVTLEQLMELSDAQSILSRSGYRPK